MSVHPNAALPSYGEVVSEPENAPHDPAPRESCLADCFCKLLSAYEP
jgi:hypothetical protein